VEKESLKTRKYPDKLRLFYDKHQAFYRRRLKTMNPEEARNIPPINTEIAVAGGGGSGLSAAVAAAEMGAKVVVLESRRSPGGNTAKAGGIFAAESHVQRRLRLDVRKDACFREAMNYSHDRVNPRIIRTYLNKSGDTIRWLEDMGLKVYSLSPYFPGQAMVTWHCPKHGVREITNVLLKRCKALGIPLFTQTRATRLLRDDKGYLCGVLARRKRQPLQINARCVIIATGGFGGNKQLLYQYSPDYMENINLIGLPHRGDGIMMALEIGAATDGLGILHMTGPGFPRSRVLTGLAIEPNTIWVNKNGVRFIDEGNGLKSFEVVNAQMRQPDMISFTLFDSGIRQYLAENGFTKGMGSLYRASRVKAAGWTKDLQSEAGKGELKIADSWDEIAGWIGVSPAVLVETIEEYNACCDHGYDPVFGKNRAFLKPLRIPPYYAMRCVPGMLGTLGGVKINECMEVLDQQNNPIPGLYCVGNDSGGWSGDTYNINLAGFTSGFAINSGRIAGENAAGYVSANPDKKKST
jgi:fumarate reductase flavoprotein subunit